MLLTFIRHAEATWRANNDFERELTEKGKQQAEHLGVFFSGRQDLPQLILSSPVVRARQTAEILSQRVPTATVLEQPWLASGMDPEVCVREISALTRFQNILLVGHEPDVSIAIAFLLGCPTSRNFKVCEASICALEIDSFSPGSAVLQYFLPPHLF